MTSDDLWRVVGRELREARERQPGNLSILAHAADAAEIDVNTAKAIERGKPATISKLEDYAGSAPTGTTTSEKPTCRSW